MLVYYIQSQLNGRKRWETHIPGFSGPHGKYHAEKWLEDLTFHGQINPDREYQIVSRGDGRKVYPVI